MMKYRGEQRLKIVLRQELRNLYINDDHGNIIPIEEFILLK